MQPEVVPFVSPRTGELRTKLIGLDQITPALDFPQLVRGWLTVGGLSVVYGPSNCGKTFFVADLAMHVSAGISWRGNRIKGGDVVYLAAEGGSGIRNRIAGMKQSKPELCKHDCFHLLPCPVDLFGNEDACAVTELMSHREIALIVVDTLARSIGDGDENSAKDVSVYIQNLDAIREKTGAHVLVIHHSGKDADRGARGSSALRAAVDTEIAISANRRVSCQKQRDLPKSETLYFDLEPVVLGQDSFGDPVTSAIVVDGNAPKRSTKPLRGKPEVAMQALNDALQNKGETRNGENFPPNRKVVHKDHWRAACELLGLANGNGSSTHKNAFNRNKNSLIELNLVQMTGDFVWKVEGDE